MAYVLFVSALDEIFKDSVNKKFREASDSRLEVNMEITDLFLNSKEHLGDASIYLFELTLNNPLTSNIIENSKMPITNDIEREVQFYANHLHITAKHLNYVCKQNTIVTASDGYNVTPKSESHFGV